MRAFIKFVWQRAFVHKGEQSFFASAARTNFNDLAVLKGF